MIIMGKPIPKNWTLEFRDPLRSAAFVRMVLSGENEKYPMGKECLRGRKALGTFNESERQFWLGTGKRKKAKLVGFLKYGYPKLLDSSSKKTTTLNGIGPDLYPQEIFK